MSSSHSNSTLFRPGPFTRAFILWSLVSLLYVSQFHPIGVASVVFVAICFFFQERVELQRKGVGIVSVVALLMCYGCTRVLSYDNTGLFLGIGTMSLTVLACWLTGISLLARRQGYAARAPHAFAAAILIGCSMTIYIVSAAFIAVPAIVLLLLSMREAMNLRATPRLLGPVVVTLVVMLSLAGTANWSESRLSYLMGLFSLLPPSGHSFPTATSLNSLQRWNNSNIVVLRGYGPNPPLYLVGRTFSSFGESNFWRWEATKEEVVPVDQMLLPTQKGSRAISVFSQAPLPTEHGPAFRIEYPQGGRGLTLYHPRDQYGVAADLRRLHYFSDGMIQALAKDKLDPGEYFLIPYKDGWNRAEPPGALPEEEREKYLALSEELTPEIARLADEIAGELDDPRQKANAVTTYLQQNFTYGYDFPFESSDTALEEFLLKRPPAHCEFFATSAALMLRAQGVPTRYINGFVLQEKSLNSDYYVIRLKHAHAWIEAYLPDEGWVTYDPTPPGTLGSPEDQAGVSDTLVEFFSNFWRKFSGFFSQNPMDMLDDLKQFLKSLTVWDYLKLVSLFGIWGLWRLYKKGRVARKDAEKPTYRYTPATMDGVTPLLEKVEQSFEKEEWKRKPSETPLAWALRLSETDLPPERLARLQAFAQSYTRVRFRQGVNEQERTELAELVKSLVEASSN